MRHINPSGVRASIGAAVAVITTGLTVLLFESPYTAWGQRTQPSAEVVLSLPAVQQDTING